MQVNSRKKTLVVCKRLFGTGVEFQLPPGQGQCYTNSATPGYLEKNKKLNVFECKNECQNPWQDLNMNEH